SRLDAPAHNAVIAYERSVARLAARPSYLASIGRVPTRGVRRRCDLIAETPFDSVQRLMWNVGVVRVDQAKFNHSVPPKLPDVVLPPADVAERVGKSDTAGPP